MGREWYFNWGSKSSKKAGGVKGRDGGGRDGSDKKSVRPKVATVAAAAAASGGCMNGVLHMFDFNHFNLCLHTQDSSYLSNEATPLKGVEAPRNSLESIIEGDKMDYSLHIPDIQIKTNRRDTKLKLVLQDTISEEKDSPAPGARTPTLVARLMGLDILPESNYNTPRSSISHITSSTPPSKARKTRKKSPYKNDVLGSQSLPDSPKSSSSSQRTTRSTNVIEQHRLSLQINKENSIVKEMESSRPSCSAINTKRREGRKYEDENKSPGYYAKQIMKQVKETVSRRGGSDITNTIGQRDIRRDDNLLSAKTPTKSNKPRLIKSSEPSKKVSEKLCFASEVLKYDDKLELKGLKPLRSKLEKQSKHERYHYTEKLDMGYKKFGVNGTKTCSKMPTNSYESIKNTKDAQFVIRPPTRANNSATEKKSKKTPFLSSDLVHGSIPSVVPLKKKDSSSIQQGSAKAEMTKVINNTSTTLNSPPTRLSRSPSQRTYEEATHKLADHEKTKDTSLAEFQYISRILKRTGIERDTPIISYTKWFSPSHPLNPTIYYNLELTHYLTHHFSPFDFNPSHSINRKLTFHLVDEILAEILNPDHEYHRRQEHQHLNGLQLVKTLCIKIKSFPCTNCQTLQDIDALVEKDMPRNGTAAIQEEDEAIVTEIEGHIVDSLVQEIAIFCLDSHNS